MTPTESSLANLGDSIVQALGAAVAEKNPAYDSLIAIGTGFVDQINQKINPTAAAAAFQVASAASALGATVAAAPAAVETLTSSSATATQKASAAGVILGDIESVGSAIASFFHF
jgi:hypothetical protein